MSGGEVVMGSRIYWRRDGLSKETGGVMLGVCMALAVSPALAQKAGDRWLTMVGARVEQSEALQDPLEAGWKGDKVCALLRETDDLRVLKCTFPPGVGHERHFHAKHFGYVLAGGKMRVTDKTGAIERELATGDTWNSDGVEWHEAENIGDTTAVYLIVEPKVH